MTRKLKFLLCFILPVFCSQSLRSQFVQTDEFNYWEDQATHSFYTTGVFFQGAYHCPGDSTLRIGNCFSSPGTASVVLAVNQNCDSIKLKYQLSWGSNSVVYVDGVSTAVISTIVSCDFDSIIIPNANAFSADGFITLVIADTILSCSGDFQVARVKVFSTPAGTTGTGTDSDPGENGMAIFPNPASGIINIQSNDFTEIIGVSILNPEGIVILTQNPETKNGLLQADLSELKAGIYLVKIQTGSSMQVKKVILIRN